MSVFLLCKKTKHNCVSDAIIAKLQLLAKLVFYTLSTDCVLHFGLQNGEKLLKNSNFTLQNLSETQNYLPLFTLKMKNTESKKNEIVLRWKVL